MPIIEIDEQTYRYLQSKAIAFVEQPGDTIKRLLGIGQTDHTAGEEGISYLKGPESKKTIDEWNEQISNYSLLAEPSSNSYKVAKMKPYSVRKPKKKRKTSLPELIDAGILHENQKLIFQNYRGVKFPKYQVVVSDGLLKWNDNLYSMSDLARTILKDLNEGYTNEAVRGPIFWITTSGETIAELWDDYLDHLEEA